MDGGILLSPPIAFVLLLLVGGFLYIALQALTFKSKKQGAGQGKPYACGEEQPERLVRPDYGQFFPFAFFFTVLHVAALTVATVPAVTLGNLFIAALYILGAIVGLLALYRS